MRYPEGPEWLSERFAEADRRLSTPTGAPVDDLLRRARRHRRQRRALLSGGLASAVVAVIVAVASFRADPSSIKVTTRPASGTTGNQTPSDSVSIPTGSRRKACSSWELAVSEKKTAAGGYLSYGLGHSAAVILFKNTANIPCSLAGYPGAAGLDASGTQITQAKRTPGGYMGGLPPGDTTAKAVTLRPGQSASAIVEGTDTPRGSATSCPKLSGLLVTPPNTRTSTRLPVAPGDCTGMEVHPVVPGITGSQLP